MPEEATKTPARIRENLEQQAESLLSLEPRLQQTVSSWLRTLQEKLGEHREPGRVEKVGRITQVADGVATVSGLPEARFNELLRFPGNVYGLVFNLDPELIGAVLLGDDTELSAGDPVSLTGKVASTPVGENLLGRVVDSLGRPIDGQGAITSEQRLPVEREAPAILERLPVEQQLITGTKAVDALIPIGRGQRELIVGDRATGKTAVAVDTIISQKDSGVISIYVAIGQKTSTVKRVVQSLRKHGVLEKTIIVSADADDSPGLQFIAPYSACTMGEYFMRNGGDVLVIYDDLTRHARAYRQLSLLLRRPPGREAYPGDIFFIHSRLLERSTRLKEEAGGGSLTALPIVETQAKNLSAYIPTNLISITDGQIFLDPDLFHKGIKPAINVGKSVSRVGGKTQLPAIRNVAGELRLEYAQFAELEVFTRFGATVEEETKRKILRGQHIREILKQQRLDPLKGSEQVVILLSIKRGIADSIPAGRLAAFQDDLRSQIPPKYPELTEKIDQGAKLAEEDWDTLAQAVQEVASQYQEKSEGTSDKDVQKPRKSKPAAKEQNGGKGKPEPEKPGGGKPDDTSQEPRGTGGKDIERTSTDGTEVTERPSEKQSNESPAPTTTPATALTTAPTNESESNNKPPEGAEQSGAEPFDDTASEELEED